MARRRPLASAVGKRLAALRKPGAGARMGDHDAVHHLRVASRRLREVLPVLAVVDRAGTEIPGVAGLRRRARRLTRALGRVRELDVALAHLDDFTRRDPSLGAGAAEVGGFLQERRVTGQTDVLTHLDSVDVEQLARRIRRVVAVASAIHDDEPRRAFLARRVAARAGELDAAIAAAGTIYVAGRVHAVRVAAKKLRYALELVREVGRVPTLALTRRLKEAQDLLGALHDLDVLAGYVRAVAAVGGRRPRDTRRLNGLIRAIDAEMVTLHADYLRRRKVLTSVVARCRRDVCPRLAEPAEATGEPAVGRIATGVP